MGVINIEDNSILNVNPNILVDNVLYEIGLSFISVRDGQWKRKLVFSPKIIFLLNIFYLITRIICIYVNESNSLTLLIMGDIGHYFQFKNIWNVILSLQAIMVISFQFLNYYNYNYMVLNQHFLYCLKCCRVYYQ